MTTIYQTETELRNLLAEWNEDWADNQAIPMIRKWIERGDGAAVYRNHDLGSPELGSFQIASFGSPAATLETATPPAILPDFPRKINWRYALDGIYDPRRAQREENHDG